MKISSNRGYQRQRSKYKKYDNRKGKRYIKTNGEKQNKGGKI